MKHVQQHARSAVEANKHSILGSVIILAADLAISIAADALCHKGLNRGDCRVCSRGGMSSSSVSLHDLAQSFGGVWQYWVPDSASFSKVSLPSLALLLPHMDPAKHTKCYEKLLICEFLIAH